MVSQTSIQSSLQLAALVSVVLLTAPPSAAQQAAAENPHDGEWSLEFSVCTRPGGVFFAIGGDEHRFNCLFQVARESFTVAADGVLKWEQREGGRLHVDDYSTLAGKTAVQYQQPVLRLTGQAAATPAGAESGRTYDRKLSLQLAWTGGSGPGIDHNGQPFVIALSADGSQWTTSGYTRAAPYQKTLWELTPASVQREEIAVDTIRESTIFRVSRQTTLIDFMAAPGFSPAVTEQIEIKHVRFLNLVPRG